MTRTLARGAFASLLSLLPAGATSAQQPALPPGYPAGRYDEAKVPRFTLPDPLVLRSGKRVADAKTWTEKRRAEILGLFETHVYGRTMAGRPGAMTWEVTAEDSAALNGTARSRTVAIYFLGKPDGPRMDLRILLPGTAAGPVPVFLVPGFANPRDPLARGYGLVTFNPDQIEPDRKDGSWAAGIRKVFARPGQTAPAADEWGAIGAWAWAMSRAMDYLETDRDVDARRVSVMGVSRWGKVAMWAGAQDQRFAIVFSGESGQGGAVLARRGYGETVRSINGYAPHWFDANFKTYNERVNQLPVDWHMLIALMAPRPVYIATAERDYWGDPRGSFLAAKSAEPVYALFGKGGLGVDAMPPVETPVGDFIGYHNRKGGHGLNSYDWEQFLNFADRHFGVVAPAATSDPRFDWFEYEGRDSIYAEVTAGPGEYLNPILPGFYPDPSMCRVGDDYYLVTSSFVYFPGVPIFHSRDLVHWAQLGYVLDRPSQLDVDSAGISRGIFAPTIRWHDSTFYMITTLVDRGGNFLVTAKNPAGPWTDPVWLPEIDGIDPSLFFDDDGKAYILNNGPPIGPPLYAGHRAIWIQEYEPAAQKLIGPRTLIVNGGVDLSKQPIWIEAPHIFKVRGQYYLIAAEGGTAEQHSEVVFRSDSVRGPWLPYPGNPILTQRHLDPARPFPITSTGHADMVETPAGEWWAIFLGTRPYQDNLYNIGRETFLMPVRWTDGWPVLTSGTETVPYLHAVPTMPPPAPPPPAGPPPAGPRPPIAPQPPSGNFVVRDDFNGPALEKYWQLIRTPRESWHDFTTEGGWITLKARPAHLGRRTQPSAIVRRQQHGRASTSSAMKYVPARPGDKAGMVAFQNDDYYFFLGVTLLNGETVVRLERHAGPAVSDDSTVIASAPVRLLPGAPIFLRIEARGGRYDFSYATAPNQWVLLKGDADGTILSTRVAKGFVGTMLGLYAYTEGK